jgi:hypothetical protein
LQKPQEELEKIVNSLRETQLQEKKKLFSDTFKETKSDGMTPDSQTSSKNTPTFTNTVNQSSQQSTIQQATVTINHHGTHGYPYKEHQQELLAEYHEVLREVREKRFNKAIQESNSIKQHTHRHNKKHKNRSRSRTRSPSSRKHKKHHHHHHKRSSSRKHSHSSRSRTRSTSPSTNRHKKKKYSHSHHHHRSRDESTKTLPVYL